MDWKAEIRLPAWRTMLRVASAFKPTPECNYPTIQRQPGIQRPCVNPLKAELNPICYLLALLRANHILHVSRIRVKPTIHLHQATKLRVRASILPHRISFQCAVLSKAHS